MIKQSLRIFLIFFLLAQPALAELPIVDKVIVYKSRRQMDMVKDGKVIRRYKIALGDNPVGHKLYEGDERTPVGEYKLTWRNPESRFHLSINVSYPDVADKAVARNMGFQPGGLIMVHGLPNGATAEDVGHPENDWTDGCIAITSEEIEEFWDMVVDGTPIIIRP